MAGSGSLTVARRIFSLPRHLRQRRFACQQAPPLVAVSVSGEPGVDEHRLVDLEGHIVDGLTLDAVGPGDVLEVLAGHIFEGYAEAHLQAEVHDLDEDSAGRSSSMIMATTPKTTFSPCQ